MISIIVPTYNLEDYIGNCLMSLLNQTYSDLEIIVIDDGSNDGTISKIKKYQDNDSRIKLIIQDNGGAASARNRGLEAASGEYIVFVDGDDMLSHDTLECNIKILEKDLSIDWVAFSIIRTDCNKNPININGIYTNKIYTECKIINSSEFVPAFFHKVLSGVCCGAIYRKSSISTIRFPKGEYYEDGFFFTDLLCNTTKGYLSNKGNYYYVHRPGSSQLKQLDEAHLKSDVACSTKRLQLYRAKFPQYERIYRIWENKLYYYYKNEMIKRTDGAEKVFKIFIAQMHSKPKIEIIQELKFSIYRIFGYNNLRRFFHSFHIN